VNNHITLVPKGIKSLIHLETFHISKNPIRLISKEFKNCTSLKDLCIDWLAYINFNSTKDNSRVEEDKDQGLWKVVKLVLYYKIDKIVKSDEFIDNHDYGEGINQ
jgi:hypothetical protein